MSITATYATLTFRVNAVEEKASKYQSDHEYILVLNSKIDRLLEDLKEVKGDMKEIKGRR